MTDAREQFCERMRAAIRNGTLRKLTLGRYRGAEATLRNLFVRPVQLKTGPHLSFVWRHATRDVTKNHLPAAAVAILEPLIGTGFLDAHLFTAAETVQLESHPRGKARLTVALPSPDVAPPSHDKAKARAIPPGAPWLRTLRVTNAAGKPDEGMAPKFRQIERFAEVVQHLLAESALTAPLEVVDMGCGKGYLTFALAAVLGPGAHISGVEARPELVDFCNRAAAEHGFAPALEFKAGTIAATPLANVDIMIALHACDTATDDALAKGIEAGASLLVVAPCCQKELRRQLRAPAVLAGPLRHGIFQERQAEFVTDALRVELLEWAGYRTKAFEFVSTEHTAKNLMITAVKAHPRGDAARAVRVRDLAAFYGIKRHALARQLGFLLT
ncbi:MAG TPA: SAM-dependent methyltransferase [Opitutaceae bacterium]|jgi:SAM-dependent methyltransferase|nr:SAM-dependent methyltransferase [Opitutaceae bacterium]